MSGERILVAHAHGEVLEKIRSILARAPDGYALEVTSRNDRVLQMAGSFAPHAIVLGRRFRRSPSGFSICKRLRRSDRYCNTGVIVVTRGLDSGEEHRVTLHGADLCLRAETLKPKVLRAGVRDLLNRVHERTGARIRLGRLKVCSHARSVWIGKRLLRLTPMQFDIVKRMAQHADRVLSPQELLGYGEAIPEEAAERVARVQVHRIRREFGAERSLIQTVRGFGYRLRVAAGGA